jgi:hypothetical protein
MQKALKFLRNYGWLYYFVIFVAFVLWKLTISRDNLMVLGKIQLDRGITFGVDEYFSSCVGFSPQSCTPMHLTLLSSGSLCLFTGMPKDCDLSLSSNHDIDSIIPPIPSGKKLWESGQQKNNDNYDAKYMTSITSTGDIIIYDSNNNNNNDNDNNNNNVVWSLSFNSIKDHPVLSGAITIPS